MPFTCIYIYYMRKNKGKKDSDYLDNSLSFLGSFRKKRELVKNHIISFQTSLIMDDGGIECVLI